MTHLSGTERAEYVQGMFARIAGRYDLMNRVMTFGQDVGWRKIVLEKAMLSPGDSFLDLGTGTGDIAFAAMQHTPLDLCVGGDFTVEMMYVGQDRPGGSDVKWSGTDALNLPFSDEQFDVVTSGFLMRNVIDVDRGFEEQFRVLKDGGRVVVLDTTPPADNMLKPFINFHMHTVIPAIGKILTGAGDAYNYLPDSTQGFLRAEQLAIRMRNVGFRDVGFKRLNFGTIAIHWGVK